MHIKGYLGTGSLEKAKAAKSRHPNYRSSDCLLALAQKRLLHAPVRLHARTILEYFAERLRQNARAARLFWSDVDLAFHSPSLERRNDARKPQTVIKPAKS